MPDSGANPAVRVTQIGNFAGRALAAGGTGEVRAVFERSFYLAAGAGWACLGTPSIGSGPLNARCDVPPGTDWRATGIRTGDRVRTGPASIRVGSGFLFSLRAASIWAPPSPPAWTAKTLRRGLASLDGATRERIPKEGLGAFARPLAQVDRTTPLAGFAIGPIASLCGWVAAAVRADEPKPPSRAAPFRQLVGLGPGLTPSGDDVLGGAMIALHLLGREDLGRMLADSILPLARAASNAISAAHLAAAAEGTGNAVLHDTLGDVLAGETGNHPARVQAVDAIGHTSGWDCLAGAVTVLRSWISAQDQTRRAA